MIPRQARVEALLRDVRQILTAKEIGLRWADNVGAEVSFRWANAAVDVPVKLPTPPAYIVARAVNRTTNAIESGCRITWTYDRGTLSVSAIDVSTPADEYDVILGIMVR
jgi:hypothetical protein